MSSYDHAIVMDIMSDIAHERHQQERQWGRQDHPDACVALLDRQGGATPQQLAEDVEIPTADRAKFLGLTASMRGRLRWAALLVEEAAGAVEAFGDDESLRHELVQVAAVAAAWIEAIDRRTST